MDRAIVFTLGASLIALLIVLELVRRRRLRESYSLLWLGIAVGMIVLAGWRDLLHGLAALVGIAYPPNLLFLLAVLAILAMLLYFSTVISRLTQENRELAQRFALLQFELERVRERAEAVQDHRQQEGEHQDPEVAQEGGEHRV
ncbi:DUF2304 domain-containing protein [Aggregatilineales bacterium SYSU G02658]